MDKASVVLSSAASHLVTGYKHVIASFYAKRPLILGISKDSPDTYEALIANADAGVLSVSPEFSDYAIYGKSGNATFRIFHDYGHILYGMKFTLQDEIALADILWAELEKVIQPEMREVCRVVYMADTKEQSLFCDQTGDFPVDQKTFVKKFLVEWLEKQA